MKTRCPRPLDEGDVAMEGANSRGLLLVRQDLVKILPLNMGLEGRLLGSPHDINRYGCPDDSL